MFSDRTAWDTAINAFAQRRADLERAGVRLLDLTESNPTRCDFPPLPGLVDDLADPANLQYEPSPTGGLAARRAVAALYEAKGVSVDPARIVLTASTSEAYSFLFRLLANPGDEFLAPTPSYPLLAYLADVNDVTLVPYPWRLQERWRVDLPAAARAVTPRTRALVVVSPNNPTGACLRRAEQAALVELCRRRELALIADEVFADYRWATDPDIPATLADCRDCLTFVLGGLSKTLGLPQMKLGWIVMTGPDALVQQALSRLEVIADTYLSVNTPVQRALPGWLAQTPAIQAPIRRRIADHRRRLREVWPGHLLPADGGWSAVLRIPQLANDEAFALELMATQHVVVYPGALFGFEAPGHLVLSLLPPPDAFGEGVRRLAATLAATLEKPRTPC